MTTNNAASSADTTIRNVGMRKMAGQSQGILCVVQWRAQCIDYALFSVRGAVATIIPIGQLYLGFGMLSRCASRGLDKLEAILHINSAPVSRQTDAD